MLEFSANYFAINEEGNISYSPEFDLPKPQHYNYDMVDGLDYTIKVSNPRGQRILNPTFQGKEVQNDDVFTLVVNNYRAMGGGNYGMVAEAETIQEIQEDMVDMAKRSVKLNSLEGKVSFLNEDLKNIEFLKQLEKFDVVTVNPPYKLNNAGIVNPNDKLAIARHEILCNLEDVISASRVLLKDNGRLFMIHRPERLADIFTLMRKYKIEPKRVKMIHPKMGKAPNIVLVEGQRDGGAYLKWEAPLYVYDDNGKYTKEIDSIYWRS